MGGGGFHMIFICCESVPVYVPSMFNTDNTVLIHNFIFLLTFFIHPAFWVGGVNSKIVDLQLVYQTHLQLSCYARDPLHRILLAYIMIHEDPAMPK